MNASTAPRHPCLSASMTAAPAGASIAPGARTKNMPRAGGHCAYFTPYALAREANLFCSVPSLDIINTSYYSRLQSGQWGSWGVDCGGWGAGGAACERDVTPRVWCVGSAAWRVRVGDTAHARPSRLPLLGPPRVVRLVVRLWVLRSCDMEYVMLHLIFSLPHAWGGTTRNIPLPLVSQIFPLLPVSFENQRASLKIARAPFKGSGTL